MNGFIINIEEATLANHDYRRVLYTAPHLQLVLMSIEPGDEIGEEVHELDQFIRLESGTARVVIHDTEHTLHDDDCVIIPQGTRHNVINIGEGALKLYSLYGPPEHKDATVHATKTEEKEEHYDGKTTE